MPFGVDLPGGGQIKSALGEVKHQVLRPLVWEENTLGKPLAEGFNAFQKDIDKLPPGFREAARVAFGVGAAGTLGTVGWFAGGPFGLAAGIGTGAALAHPKSSGAASSLLLPSSLIGFGMPGAAIKSLGVGLRGISLLSDAERVMKPLALAAEVGGETYKATDIARFGVNLEKWGTKLMEAEQAVVSGGIKAAAYPVYKPLSMLWKAGGVIPRTPLALADQLKSQVHGEFIRAFGDPMITKADDLKTLGEDLIYRAAAGHSMTGAETNIVSLVQRLNPENWEGQLRSITSMTPRNALDYMKKKVALEPTLMKDIAVMPKIQAAWDTSTRFMRPLSDQWVEKVAPVLSLPSAAFLEFLGYAPANVLESLMHMTQLPPQYTGVRGFLEGAREALTFGLAPGKRTALKQFARTWGDIPGAPEQLRRVAERVPESFVFQAPTFKWMQIGLRKMQAPMTEAMWSMSFEPTMIHETTKLLPEGIFKDALGDIPMLADKDFRWRAIYQASQGPNGVLKYLPHITTEKVAAELQGDALSQILSKHIYLPTEARNELVAASEAGWRVNPDELVNSVVGKYRQTWQATQAASPAMIAEAMRGITQEARAAVDAGKTLAPEELDSLWSRWQAIERAGAESGANADRVITEASRSIDDAKKKAVYFTKSHEVLNGGMNELVKAREEGLGTLLSLPGAADRTGAQLADMNDAWNSVREAWANWHQVRSDFFSPGGKYFKLKGAKKWDLYYSEMPMAWESWRARGLPAWNRIINAAVQGEPAAMTALPGAAAPTTASLLGAKAERAAVELESDIRSLFSEDTRLISKRVVDADRATLQRIADASAAMTPAERKQIADAFSYGMKKATDQAHMISIDASNLTIVDGFFRAIGMPYFSYEARRFPRMLNLVMQRPGIARNLYKFFTDASDEGYVKVPGTPMDVSLFRMLGLGPLRSMQQPYWPPEHDGFMGMLERTTADMTKFGFFPISLQMATSAATGQIQQILPPPLESASAALELIPKSVPIVGGIRLAEILPSFFNTDSRQAYMKAQLIDMGIDPATATEDDMDKARKSVNLALLSASQIGVTRFKPELIRKITDVRGDVAAKYGVPADTIKAAQQSGRNPIYARDAADMPFLNKAQADTATDEAAAILGVPPEAVRAVSDIWLTIRPEKQQKAGAFYDDLAVFDKQGEENQLSAPAKSVLEGKSLPYEWRQKRTEYYTYRDLVRRKLLGELGLTEADLKYAPDSPKRKEDVLAEQYYSMDPDADGDGIITKEEWTAYDVKTKAFFADCTPAEVDYIKNSKTMPWKDQNNINLETRLRRAKDVVQTLFDTPKYLGIPVAVQDQIDAVTDQEAQFHYNLRAKGMLSTAQLPNNDAVWQAFANYLSRTDPKLMPYFALANRERSSKFRAAFQNPERLNLLYRNSDVLAFYPDLAQSLSDDERLILGIGPRATGEEGILQKWAKTLKSGAAS